MAAIGPSTDTLDHGALNGREPDWLDQPVSGTELAKGLLLLRASNMNVVRLQLAMERSDRRTAMEALDGLVALDRELSGFISEMPAPDSEYSAMARRIDAQKSSVASEKLIFAAGTRGPTIAQGLAAEAAAVPTLRQSANPEETASEIEAYEYHEEPSARQTPWATILSALVVVAAATFATLYVVGMTPALLSDRLSLIVGGL